MLDTRPACFPLTCAVFATDAGGRLSYCCSVLLGSPPGVLFCVSPLQHCQAIFIHPSAESPARTRAPHTAATKTKIKPQAGQKNDAGGATRPQLVIVCLPECGYWGAAQNAESETSCAGAVAGLVGIEGGVVSGVFNLESLGVRAPSRRPRHDKRYHEARTFAADDRE